MNTKLTKLGLLALSLALCLSSFSTSAYSADAPVALPAGALDRLAELDEQLGIDTPWRRALQQEINPDDYECTWDTPLRNWIGASINSISAEALDVIRMFSVDAWPTYYTALFDNGGKDTYIGVDGEHTKEQIKRHRSNQRFWDVKSDDILLLGMHGADIADDAKMVPLLQVLFGVDAATAAFIVDLVQDTIENDDTVDYDHPLFTLNAFAASFGDEPAGSPFEGRPDMIVMGEGLIEAIAAVGYGTDGPDFVHAHEFGHHVQFELGLFDSHGHTPEETRYTELMADALGAYYCAHARGATFQAKRLVDVVNSAYDIGDCAFGSGNHHGTPNQREAAVLWGANLAASAKKQGHILSATDVQDLFDAYYPTLIAPDAE